MDSDRAALRSPRPGKAAATVPLTRWQRLENAEKVLVSITGGVTALGMGFMAHEMARDIALGFGARLGAAGKGAAIGLAAGIGAALILDLGWGHGAVTGGYAKLFGLKD